MSVTSTEEAGSAMAAMWKEIADYLSSYAIESAALGKWGDALAVGAAADVARWQSTGEGECDSIKSLLERSNASFHVGGSDV